jgi:hypothetical protein
MMQRAFFCAGAFILVLAGLVLAGGSMRAAVGPLPPRASQQSPPWFVDETDLKLYLTDYLGGPKGYSGYVFNLQTRIYGPISKSDAARVDFTQGGKVLASQRCPLRRKEYFDSGDSAGLDCPYKGDGIKAVGPVTVNLIYIDDQAGKEYLIRQFNVTVAVFPWMQEKHYQILHDDMLGVAYAWHAFDTHGDIEGIRFQFWTAGSFKESPQLRCTVNGRREPDFQTALGSQAGSSVSQDALINGNKLVYSWLPQDVSVERLRWGTREEIKETLSGSPDKDKILQRMTTEDGYRLIADMAGDWSCDLRYQGNVIRQFSFQVNDKGRILRSAAQSAPGFPRLVPGVVHVDMRLPAKNSFDDRVRPAAIAKSMPYGMPWPKHPMIDAFRQSLPPASGLQDPPGTGTGKRGTGK